MGKAKCNSLAHTRLSPLSPLPDKSTPDYPHSALPNLVNSSLERLKSEDNQVRMSLHLPSSKSSDGQGSAVLLTGRALLWDTGVPRIQGNTPWSGRRAGPYSAESKSRGGKNSSALGSGTTPPTDIFYASGEELLEAWLKVLRANSLEAHHKGLPGQETPDYWVGRTRTFPWYDP